MGVGETEVPNDKHVGVVEMTRPGRRYQIFLVLADPICNVGDRGPRVLDVVVHPPDVAMLCCLGEIHIVNPARGWAKPDEFATWSQQLPETVGIDEGKYNNGSLQGRRQQNGQNLLVINTEKL